jgi:hypothetical protein
MWSLDVRITVVWVDHTDNLAGLKQARGRALAKLFDDHAIGVAHH